MNPLKFIKIAQAVADMSKDPSTKVGAVAIADDGTILSVGYNGFPRGVDDAKWRYNAREIKYKLIAHAELNVVAQAARKGIRLEGATLVLTALYPCSNCAKAIIQAGFKAVYAPEPDRGSATFERWKEEAETSTLLFSEAGVQLVAYNPMSV